ncbi:hypothetical protein [Pseudomonas orientalis]|uniref:hypothetical protein n=1 Tax=Pseudomonas orientalis TaxID=76758 RepID=UPI00070DBF4A|nr:hypothetical protein [Pseudomonas orientalis]KRP64861.1 hypothetical protein TU82_14150 [Pseudomonas orientalis]
MEAIGQAGGQMAMQLISGLMKGLAGGGGGGGGDEGGGASAPSRPGEDNMPPPPPKIDFSVS